MWTRVCRSTFCLFLFSLGLTLLAFAVLLYQTYAELFAQSTFYFLFTTSVFLLLALQTEAQKISQPWQNRRTDMLIALALGFGLTSGIFFVVGFDFRILSDETNLLATSLDLFLNQELKNITEIQYYYHSENIKTAETAHRPGFFSFLASLLHFLIGFRWFNGFVLNFLVSVASIALFYLFFSTHKDRLFGVLSAVLLAAFPVFQLNITSSGFDALNMLMVMLVYIQLVRFLREPDGAGLEVLLLLVILAAQVRYETMVLGLPVLIALFHRPRQLWQWQYSPRFALIPLLALPIVWQKLVSSNFANPGDAASEALQIDHILPNFINMLKFFSDWENKGVPTYRLITALALVGLLLLLWQIYKKHTFSRPVWLALGLCLLGQVLISIAHFMYYTGNYQLAWISRLAQVQLVWLIPLAAYALHNALMQMRQPLLWAGIFGALILLHGSNAAYKNPVGKSLFIYRQFKDTREYLQQHYAPHNTLVINYRSGMYAALGYSALSPNTAKAMQAALKINLERGLFQTILVIDVYNHNTHQIQNPLPAEFQLIEQAAFQFDAVSSTKIYKLKF